MVCLPGVGRQLWIPIIRECYIYTTGKLAHTPLGCHFYCYLELLLLCGITFIDLLRPMQQRSSRMSCIHGLSYFRGGHICATSTASAHFYAPQFLCLYGPYTFRSGQPLRNPASEKSFIVRLSKYVRYSHCWSYKTHDFLGLCLFRV